MNEREIESELMKYLTERGVDFEEFIADKQNVMKSKGKLAARAESQALTLKLDKIIKSRK